MGISMIKKDLNCSSRMKSPLEKKVYISLDAETTPLSNILNSCCFFVETEIKTVDG